MPKMRTPPQLASTEQTCSLGSAKDCSMPVLQRTSGMEQVATPHVVFMVTVCSGWQFPLPRRVLASHRFDRIDSGLDWPLLPKDRNSLSRELQLSRYAGPVVNRPLRSMTAVGAVPSPVA